MHACAHGIPYHVRGGGERVEQHLRHVLLALPSSILCTSQEHQKYISPGQCTLSGASCPVIVSGVAWAARAALFQALDLRARAARCSLLQISHSTMQPRCSRGWGWRWTAPDCLRVAAHHLRRFIVAQAGMSSGAWTVSTAAGILLAWCDWDVSKSTLVSYWCKKLAGALVWLQQRTPRKKGRPYGKTPLTVHTGATCDWYVHVYRLYCSL